MAAKRTPDASTKPPITAQAEHAFAAGTTDKARSPSLPPVQGAQPPVPADPIRITPAAPARPVATSPEFPRIMRLIFKDPVTFAHNQLASKEINLNYEQHAKFWTKLELCMYLGRLSFRLEATVRSSGEVRVYRMPFEAVQCFETVDDNPMAKPAVISVNEIAKQVTA
jgi:hypothetical protein